MRKKLSPALNFRRSWMTIMFIVAVSLFLCASFWLSKASAWIPQAILSATLLLLVAQFALELTSGSRATLAADSPDETGNHDQETTARNGAMKSAFTWIGALLLAVWMFGAVIGVTLFCLAYLHWHAAERWPVSIVFALGLGLVVQLLFGTFLKITLYPGIFS
jgi:beta-lactamase regulating signal transducer with metallopeptidase domain